MAEKNQKRCSAYVINPVIDDILLVIHRKKFGTDYSVMVNAYEELVVMRHFLTSTQVGNFVTQFLEATSIRSMCERLSKTQGLFQFAAHEIAKKIARAKAKKAKQPREALVEVGVT